MYYEVFVILTTRMFAIHVLLRDLNPNNTN